MLVAAASSIPNVDSLVAHIATQIKQQLNDNSFASSDELKILLNDIIKSGTDTIAETLYSNEQSSMTKKKLDGMKEHYLETLTDFDSALNNLTILEENLEDKTATIQKLEQLCDEQRDKIIEYEEKLTDLENLNLLRQQNEIKTNQITRLQSRVNELQNQINEINDSNNTGLIDFFGL